MKRRSKLIPLSRATHIMVVDGPAHAKAILRWWKFDPKDWSVVYWGERCKGSYKHAFLALPSGGVTEQHRAWFEFVFLPCVSGKITATHQRLLDEFEINIPFDSH